jgi:hypothetical protein
VSITSGKLHEIQTETRFFKLDRLSPVLSSIAFAVLAMVPWLQPSSRSSPASLLTSIPALTPMIGL